nr:MAG TPA: hypothetical protein [Caudoviricetes sp.]
MESHRVTPPVQSENIHLNPYLYYTPNRKICKIFLTIYIFF